VEEQGGRHAHPPAIQGKREGLPRVHHRLRCVARVGLVWGGVSAGSMRNSAPKMLLRAIKVYFSPLTHPPLPP
jgi:hypothetical protein